MMEAVDHASGTLPLTRASLQKPIRSLQKALSFQTVGEVLFTPGDLEEFKWFTTDKKRFRYCMLVELRAGEIRRTRRRAKKRLEVFIPDVQMLFSCPTWYFGERNCFEDVRSLNIFQELRCRCSGLDFSRKDVCFSTNCLVAVV